MFVGLPECGFPVPFFLFQDCHGFFELCADDVDFERPLVAVEGGLAELEVLVRVEERDDVAPEDEPAEDDCYEEEQDVHDEQE